MSRGNFRIILILNLTYYIKKEVFKNYGNKCACCNEKIFEFLSIDHINGRIDSVTGKKDTRKGHKIYTWLKRNNYPPGYQLLCHNCNSGKRAKKECPHKTHPVETTWTKYKKQAIYAYSNFCICCKENDLRFLTIDHVNNDGAKHREEIKSSETKTLYFWLIKNNFPVGFQILCFNCNFGKQIYKGRCPHNSI